MMHNAMIQCKIVYEAFAVRGIGMMTCYMLWCIAGLMAGFTCCYVV